MKLDDVLLWICTAPSDQKIWHAINNGHFSLDISLQPYIESVLATEINSTKALSVVYRMGVLRPVEPVEPMLHRRRHRFKVVG